ncbi:MAG: hypothetical protein R8F63_10945 [Acidimicrobiales bacterium]|nr:hypothetical protein [Acidimicrobiales bacterium]
MTIPSTRRLLALFLGLMLVLAACGDDGDDGRTADPADDPEPVETDDSGDDGTDDGADDGPSAPSGDAGALVTIFPVGEELTFPQELVCVALQGALSATFTDGAGLEMSIDLPVEDWESSTTVDWAPPSMTVRDERDELNWRIFESGPDIGLAADVDASTAVINDFSIDGRRATGSGQMIDTFAVTTAAAGGTEMPTPVPFAFAVECAG